MSSLYVAATVDPDTDKEVMELQPAAIINAKNIKSFKFTFSPGADITDSLNKGGRKPFSGNNRKAGRTAYTSSTCVYPDDSSSTSLLLEGCIIQYRSTMERTGTPNTYGKSYVCIGIPQEYVKKIVNDAMVNSSINLEMKDEKRRLEGYCWVDCNLDKITDDTTFITYIDDTGRDSTVNMNLEAILRDFKKSLEVIILCVVSGSMSNDNTSVKLDLEKGKYNLGVKPIEIHIIRESDIIGPTVELQGRKKEASALSERLKCDTKMAAYARRHMLGEGK